jgi:hypothetical protein
MNSFLIAESLRTHRRILRHCWTSGLFPRTDFALYCVLPTVLACVNASSHFVSHFQFMLCPLKTPAAMPHDDIVRPGLDLTFACCALIVGIHSCLLRHTCTRRFVLRSHFCPHEKQQQATLRACVTTSTMQHTKVDGWPFLVAGLASQRVLIASSAGVDAAPDFVSRLNCVVSVIQAPAAPTKENILWKPDSLTTHQQPQHATITVGIKSLSASVLTVGNIACTRVQSFIC